MRNYFRPNALGHAYQQATKFPPNNRLDQTAERYLLEFDVSRRNARARGIIGGAFPGGFVSISRMQNAALSGAEQTLGLSSVQGAMDFPTAAKQMRRLYPCGGSARQDVLTAADMDAGSDEGDPPYTAWVAYWGAKEKMEELPRRPNSNSKGADKITGDGHALNSFNQRTGGRTRCYTCDSAYRPATKCPQRKRWRPTSTPSPPIGEKSAPFAHFPYP